MFERRATGRRITLLFCMGIIYLGISPTSHAAPYTVTKEAPPNSNLNLLTGLMTYTWTIPPTDNGCPITKKDGAWSILVGTQSFSGYNEGYAEWKKVSQTTVLCPVTVIENTPQKKSAAFVPACLDGTAVGSPAMVLKQARVEAEYDCALASPPQPKKCEKKLWCEDTDSDGIADGVFLAGTESCEKPGDKWTPAKKVEPPNTGWYACTKVIDNCRHTANASQTDSDKDGVGDVCDNCPTSKNTYQNDTDKDGIGNVCDVCTENPDPNAKKWGYFLDKDKDGIPDLATKDKQFLSCPPPPAGYVSYKGQWDTCDDIKAPWWYWDEDKDNHGNPNDKIKTCLQPKAKNTKGHWILSPADDQCDDDPTAFVKQNWYWDWDMDGFGTDDSLSFKPHLNSCKPAPVSSGQGQWVTKKGDECDTTIPSDGTAHVQKKTEFYRDQDGDGLLSPKDMQKFCTAALAKNKGYFPESSAPSVQGPAPAPKAGSGGIPGADKPMNPSGPPPSAGDTKSAQPQENTQNTANPVVPGGWDCDDNDPKILSQFYAFRDADNDSFGDSVSTKQVSCTKDNPDILAKYKTGKVAGWAANRADLSDILWANTMELNLALNPNRAFILSAGNKEDGNYSESICMSTATNLLECLEFLDFVKYCVREDPSFNLLALPRITFEQIEPIWKNLQVTQFMQPTMLECLAPRNVKPLQWYHHAGSLYVVTNFQPFGRLLLPIIGTNFFIPLSVTLEDLINDPETTGIYDTSWDWIGQMVTNQLQDLPGPIPVGVADDLPDSAEPPGTVVAERRIVAGGVVGPVYQVPTKIQPIAINKAIPVDLLEHPLLYAYQKDLNQMTQTSDQDADYLPDAFEEQIGLDPTEKDDDGDGVDDVRELLWSGKLPFVAGSAQYTPKLAQASMDSGKQSMILTDFPLTGDENAEFTLAKQKAEQRIPNMMKRLKSLYGNNKLFTIHENLDLVGLLVGAKSSTIAAPHVELENGDWSPTWDIWGEYPLVTVNTLPPFMYGTHMFLGCAYGCGPTGNDICIDLAQHFLHGATAEEYLVKSLLHEVLHHVIFVNGSQSQGAANKMEHMVIDDVLGRQGIDALLD